MENILQNFLEEIGNLSPWIAYLSLFFSAILQNTFPPYPGDTILVFGGYLGSTGVFGGEIPIFLSYWLGTIASSLALYELGALRGESLLKLKIVSRYFPKPSQDKAKRLVSRYGIIMLFICKFIPGLNFLVIIFGGVLKFRKAWAYAAVGFTSIVHNVLFLNAGKAIGSNLDSISKFLSAYNKVVFTLVGACAIIYVIYRIIKIKKKAKSLN